jgi:hypothetical protein
VVDELSDPQRLHDHHELALMAEGGMKRRYVGMIEARQQPDLAEKAFGDLLGVTATG